MERAQCLGRGGAPRTQVAYLVSLDSVTRRHVDLLRVSSALCPGDPALV